MMQQSATAGNRRRLREPRRGRALRPIASRPPSPRATCRTGAATYTRLELLFGLGKQDGGEVSDEEWRAFIEMEVTPRFPDGLTVLTAYGQWRGRSGEIARETSRVLVIWYRRGADSEADIEAIRHAYKAQFSQESVMRVDGALVRVVLDLPNGGRRSTS